MRRREFITLLGGVALAWPLAARAEQADRIRRVGVLMGYAETDPQAKALLAEFTRAVSEFGWIEGRTLRMDVRWAPGNTDLMRTFAKELVSLQPDVILEIEAVISSLGREPGSGLLGMPDNFIEIHRALIISLAARNSVPAVYQTPIIARDGGLLSYGVEFQDLFHRSARYIDNILRGAKPSELPVQLPLKYFMVVNLKTAKALGLTVPPTLLATADEVIE